MNDIYIKISKLSDKFITMCYGLTTNKTEIEDAVQELMLYFLNMNPETLKSIYEKDGEKGIMGFGAVVLKRALTSTRSPFYYKYKKYYTHIDSIYETNTTLNHKTIIKYLNNLPEIKVDNSEIIKLDQIDAILDTVHWYDKKVFELYYYDNNTLDSLAKKTKISRNSLFTTIDKVRSIIKNELIDE
tara:strand:+ start:3215 stop:3772 length:558 start_codon:yes stop_codon:yes gene_type:complete